MPPRLSTPKPPRTRMTPTSLQAMTTSPKLPNKSGTSQKSRKSSSQTPKLKKPKREAPVDYQVEKILNKRRRPKNVKAGGTWEYLIKWENYDDSHNSWEPARNLKCPELLERFEDEWKKKQQENNTQKSYKCSKKQRRSASSAAAPPAKKIKQEVPSHENEKTVEMQQVEADTSARTRPLVEKTKTKPKRAAAKQRRVARVNSTATEETSGDEDVPVEMPKRINKESTRNDPQISVYSKSNSPTKGFQWKKEVYRAATESIRRVLGVTVFESCVWVLCSFTDEQVPSPADFEVAPLGVITEEHKHCRMLVEYLAARLISVQHIR